MKDTYPALNALPLSHLAPAAAQPDYSNEGLPDWVDYCNVGHLLSDAQVAAGRGNLVAAVQGDGDSSYTFDELAKQSSDLARRLVKLGVQPGDRIAYQSPNLIEVLVVMLAIWKAGGVVVPIPTYAGTSDIFFFISDTGARFVFVHSGVEKTDVWDDITSQTKLEEVIFFGSDEPSPAGVAGNNLAARADDIELPRVDPDQPAIIWHTGGTTGQPKGCYHTHRRFVLGGLSFGQTGEIQPQDQIAVISPMGHALGIIHNTIFCMLHGATAVFIERFSDPAAVLTGIERHRVSLLTGLMASWGKLASHIKKEAPDADTSSLSRCFAMWQSASSADVYDFWLARGVELLNNFGSTSFATWVLIPAPHAAVPRASLGTPALGYEVAAVEVNDGQVQRVPDGDIGLLAVKGPTGLTYWNRPELQERDVKDGWSLADDLIRIDEDGFVHYLGRSDYLISTGGFKVAPGEVETVLARHNLVKEVAVVPAPCPKLLQKVVA